MRHRGRPGAWVASVHGEHGNNIGRLLRQGEEGLTQHLHADGEYATHVCPFQCARQAAAQRPFPYSILEAPLSLGLTTALNPELETQPFCDGRAGRTRER